MNPNHAPRSTRSALLSACAFLATISLWASGCSEQKSDPVKQAPDQSAAPAHVITVRLASTEPHPDYTPVADPTRGTIYVAPEVVVSNEHIKSAKAAEGQYGAVVDITLTDEGGRKMEAFTEAHLGKLVAMMVDDCLKSSATINSVVRTRIQLTGSFTIDEAKEIASALNP